MTVTLQAASMSSAYWGFSGVSDIPQQLTESVVQISLPLRLGGTFNAGRCNPQTSAGIVANETVSGCGSAADNALLTPAPAPAAAAST